MWRWNSVWEFWSYCSTDLQATRLSTRKWCCNNPDQALKYALHGSFFCGMAWDVILCPLVSHRMMLGSSPSYLSNLPFVILLCPVSETLASAKHSTHTPAAQSQRWKQPKLKKRDFGALNAVLIAREQYHSWSENGEVWDKEPFGPKY